MSNGRMPGNVAQAIFDAFVRTGRVPVEEAEPWRDEVALIGAYADPEEWITTAVGQDWVPMPPDVQERLGGLRTYSEGSSLLRHRRAGPDRS